MWLETGSKSGIDKFLIHIDREGRVWTVPAPRTKGNREHRVPLCRRALEVLEEARAIGPSRPLVFPGKGESRSGTRRCRNC